MSSFKMAASLAVGPWAAALLAGLCRQECGWQGKRKNTSGFYQLVILKALHYILCLFPACPLRLIVASGDQRGLVGPPVLVLVNHGALPLRGHCLLPHGPGSSL